MATLPLEGIRVIDFGVVYAVPYATMFLGDMGAEVIKVESRSHLVPATRGVFARPSKELEASQPYGLSQYPDRDPGARPWNRYAPFNAWNRNKRSISIDATRPEGRDVFLRLIKVSDVLVENNSVGSMEHMGLDYPRLREIKPDLIMLSIAGCGQTGPWSGYRGYGANFEQLYGHCSLYGYPDMDATTIPSTVVADAACGISAAFTIAMALHHRNQTGKGQYIDQAMGETMVNHLGEVFMDYTMNGRVTTTTGNRQPNLVQGCYRCAGNDEWITITIANDQQWRSLCDYMGRPDLAADERFSNVVSRYRHHDEVDQILESWAADKNSFDLFHALQRAGVPAGPIMHEDHVYADPQALERGFFASVTQEDCGTHLYPSTTFRMSKTPFLVRRPPVLLGEGNEYVLKELLGVTDEEYQHLESLGHIGMDYDASVR